MPTYVVYHYDTFDHDKIWKGAFQTLDKAEEFVKQEYKGRLSPSGADLVDIVCDGNIVRSYKTR